VTGSLALQLLAGLGGLAGIAAIINALLSRPKIRAEATNIATQTTVEIFDQLRKEVERLTTDNAALRNRVDALEKAEDVSDQVLRETRTALWETWQYVKRQHGYLTDVEKAELGPLPDVGRFFPPSGGTTT
jgi:predicted kinase